MNILALDTATEACSAALLTGERIAGRELEPGRGHAEHILPLIDDVLARAGMTLRGIDAIAFGRGPGAFTGVRLAASIAQGLAFGAELPVVPVSDLQALAQRALDSNEAAGRVLVCADARMKEVYWACFERDGNGEAALVGCERVGKPESVVLPPDWTMPVLGAGRGFRAYPALREVFGARLAAIEDDLLPRAHEIARLAARRFARGDVVPPDEAIPVYLRDDVARPSSRD